MGTKVLTQVLTAEDGLRKNAVVSGRAGETQLRKCWMVGGSRSDVE